MKQFQSRPFIIFCILIAILVLAFTFGISQKSRVVRAQPSETIRFAVIGDYGDEELAQVYVSDMVKSWNPDFIITVGDNNYPDGAASTIDDNIGQYYSDFIYPYYGSYGPGGTVNRFFPTLGNHDWNTEDAQPYLDYFTLPGNERYYSFREGPVEFFAIDSDRQEPDGNDPNSVQAQWLQSALEASTASWRVVYFHHPPYSSAETDDNRGYASLQWPFEEWGASVVLSGHAHSYERIMRDDFPYIVNGLGGKSPRAFFDDPVDGSVVRYNASNGAMLVEATSDYMTFEFYSAEGRPMAYNSYVVEEEWAEFDVTSAVQANDTYSFGVSSAHAASLLFTSKENVANQPELVVEMEDNLGSIQTLTFNPVEDTYVKSSSASGNYGAETAIRTKLADDEFNSYLKFYVTGIVGRVRSAQLRLFVESGPETGAAVYAVSNNLLDSTILWSEETLTWHNAPLMRGPDVPLDSLTIYSASSPALPVISIVNPTEGSTIGDTVLIEAVATDRTDLPQELDVEIRFDGGDWLPTTFNAITGYHEFLWETLALDAQTEHTIEARVVDSQSNTVTAPPITVTTAPPESYTFIAVDDAYVDATEPDANFGSHDILYFDGDPVRRGYIRFELEGLSGNVQGATLRVYSLSNSNIGYEVSTVADNSWDESTITYSNAPNLGSLIATSGPITNESWNEFDVTALIAGDGSLSFALTTSGSTQLVTSSSEGAYPAELIIDVAPSEVPSDGSDPPDVSINTPADGNTVTEDVLIQLNVSDDWDLIGNLLVEVSVDGVTNWQSATWNVTTASYEANWDSLSVPGGSHTIHARVTDSHGQTTHARPITVFIDGANTTPEAVEDTYSVTAGEVLEVPAPGVLENDRDGDEHTLTAWLVNPPTYGTVDLNTDGSFVYSPGTALSGTDLFTYTVHDGKLTSKPQAVIITIEPGHTMPVVNIVAPENGHSLIGPVTIQAEVNGDLNATGALGVELRFDDANTWETLAWNSGSGYYEKIWNPASTTPGTHTVYVRAFNGYGTYVLAEPLTIHVGELQTLHVHDLNAIATMVDVGSRRNWQTEVTVTVFADDDVTPVANASVTGTWNNEEIVTAKTNADGEAIFTSTIAATSNTIDTLTFNVTDITHSTLSYDASSNHVPDPDNGDTSDGTSISISRPE